MKRSKNISYIMQHINQFSFLIFFIKNSEKLNEESDDKKEEDKKDEQKIFEIIEEHDDSYEIID